MCMQSGVCVSVQALQVGTHVKCVCKGISCIKGVCVCVEGLVGCFISLLTSLYHLYAENASNHKRSTQFTLGE